MLTYDDPSGAPGKTTADAGRHVARLDRDLGALGSVPNAPFHGHDAGDPRVVSDEGDRLHDPLAGHDLDDAPVAPYAWLQQNAG
ncbi:hypothetical protein CJ026_026180 [Ralstonia pickettii]|uniref:hypothetical protein n=1 Tax=Ralstonia pickettii TaxID=329 RepID=UPI000CD57E50|nr:hypothetical protein CJ026_026180 [Ralstonia pickettii]